MYVHYVITLRALCDGYEIFMHYVMNMKCMCTMLLTMIYMVAMKINEERKPQSPPC